MSLVKPDFFLVYFWRLKKIIPVRFAIVAPTRHCPAHIIIGRAIQWNMPSGVAGLLSISHPVDLFAQSADAENHACGVAVHHIAVDEYKSIVRHRAQRSPFFPHRHVAASGNDNVGVGLRQRSGSE
ncbi:hypothetical protein [Candidatus Spongiihabitans sp.]|uniref:hypothetical protein n=1 Tax=Candidatus Spongiihabitans sp. TaxID=3101308 RepID=UPI003C7A8077